MGQGRLVEEPEHIISNRDKEKAAHARSLFLIDIEFISYQRS